MKIRHHGECVVRTPLLPFNVIEEELTVERLREHLANPIIREALFLASPSLDAAIEAWILNPHAARARGVQIMVARYLARMASRPTPFGLFSACAVATISESTSLSVAAASECHRTSKLDMGYLTQICDALECDPTARRSLRYRPNSSIAIMGGELRYIDPRIDALTGTCQYQLATVERTAELDLALSVAQKGATFASLAKALTADSNLCDDDALAFIDELVDARLLQSNIHPHLSSDDLMMTASSALAGAESTVAFSDRLDETRHALRRLDAEGLGVSRDQYRDIMGGIASLPARLDPARLFRVDLSRPTNGLRVGERVVDELQCAIALLHRITPTRGSASLNRFREQFVALHGAREVPLAEALDEERGIGFALNELRAVDPSPLLIDIELPSPATARKTGTPQDHYKTYRLIELLAKGEREWELDERDLSSLAVQEPAPLPTAMAARVAIAARSSAEIDRGEFELFVRDIVGPSGASLLGRFCQGDPAIRSLVERHIRAEEDYQSKAAFAEIIHLPDPRLGNLVCRPVLRSYEIPYLGFSGAPLEQQITVDDLRLSVRGDRFHLRSVRLNREVIPRLSAAHNYRAGYLSVYVFLCALQQDGLSGSLRWDWGSLEGAPFLPRVKRGRLILSLATWTIATREIERIFSDPALRRTFHFPRWVCVVDGDNLLPVDLRAQDAPARITALGRGNESIQLQELYPPPNLMCASGKEGRYAHEIVIPFTQGEREKAGATSVFHQSNVARSFSPGSRWLYAKVYAGPATSDAVLRTAIAPLVRDIFRKGFIESWFYIRYFDPEPHLRIRFEGDPSVLLRDVLPALHDRIAPFLESGRITRFQIDTYERELERYGGSQAIETAERIFCADSNAAMEIVEASPGDAGANMRWRLALYGMHMMLMDADISDAARLTLVARARAAFGAEHRLDARAHRSIGARYRSERGAIEQLFEGKLDGHPEIGPLLQVIRRRSEKLVPAFADLRAFADRGTLETPLEDLLQSLLHMHVNRMIRDNQRTHEMVFYNFLFRAYDSTKARTRSSSFPASIRREPAGSDRVK